MRQFDDKSLLRMFFLPWDRSSRARRATVFKQARIALEESYISGSLAAALSKPTTDRMLTQAPSLCLAIE